MEISHWHSESGLQNHDNDHACQCNGHSLIMRASVTKSSRKSNSDGLLLAKSGSVSMITKQVNAKNNASYCNSDNTNKLLERSLTPGQA